MTKHSILIAIEDYAATTIGAVPHARRDAEAFALALAPHGFDQANQLILIDDQATKQAIESQVMQAIQRLKKDDTLFFYFAGRGFSQDGANFIASHDVQDADWRESSVALAPILSQIRAAHCQPVAVFLDCRPCRLKVADESGEVDAWTEQELESFVDDAPQRVCFVASRFDESSHSSDHLRHGIWAYHLIEAFQGDAPLALERGMLTADSLQSYVQAETPRTLRKESPRPPQQTPWRLGAAGSGLVLADLREILARRQQQADPGASLTAELTFTVSAPQELRSLSAWKTSYRIPDSASGASERFVAGIAKEELGKDLDRVYDALRKAFGFARRDMQPSQVDDGSGTIITPHFNYAVTVSLDAENPSQIIWTRTIDAIKSPEQINSPAFAQVFDGVFDTLDLSLPKLLHIEDFIDMIEAAKIPGVQLAYDREATYCQLRLPETAGVVTVKAGSVAIVHDRPQKTRKLIESFEAVRRLLNSHHPLAP